jgi:hypothetical protein
MSDHSNNNSLGEGQSKRITKLTHLLSELGFNTYSCPISPDSVDLVEQLLNELLVFTNSYKQIHEQLVQVTTERDYCNSKLQEFDETSKYFESSVKEFAKERELLLGKIGQLEADAKKKDDEIFKLHQVRKTDS